MVLVSSISWILSLLFISVAVFFWVTSDRFRYQVKMAFYVCSTIITGLIVWPYCALFFGRTTENHFRSWRVFHWMIKWTNIRFRYRNLDHLSNLQQPCVIIANHQSELDVIGLSHVWPENCVALMKSSIRFLPGVNACCYFAKDLFIDRFSRENAHKSLDDAVRAVQQDKSKVWIFPEGTRNHNEGLLSFKKGAFVLAKRTKIPIVPVVFSSYKPFYDKNSSKFHLNGHVIIEALPAIDSEQFDTVEQLADECRSRMLEVFGRISKEAEEWSNEITMKPKGL